MRRAAPRLRAPFLKEVRWDDRGAGRATAHPFDIPWLGEGFRLVFERPVTVLAGENGTGKSTLIEALAALAGFGADGGTRDHRTGPEGHGGAALAACLRASWLPKVTAGWFFRAETFHPLARYLDDIGSPSGGLLDLSHGEGFFRLMSERLSGRGLFLLDEPESALSVASQARLLAVIADLSARGEAQVVMATHSPILMAVPGAEVIEVTHRGLHPTGFRATRQFRLWQAFATDPDGFVAHAVRGEIDLLD